MIDKIRRGFELLSVSDDVISFAEQNEQLWDEQRPEGNHRWVVIDMKFKYPKAVVSNSVFANHLAADAGLPIVGMFDYRFDRKTRLAARSYSIKDSVFLFSGLRNPRRYLSTYLKSKRLLRQLERPEQLIKLEYDGLVIGDLIYNSYLRTTGNGTISTITPELFKFIHQAVLLKEFSEQIFKSYPPYALVSGDVEYSRTGVPARVALEHGASVYTKKFSQIHNIWAPSLDRLDKPLPQPDQKLFEQLFESHRDALVELGEQHLKERLNSKSNLQTRLAYADSKATLERSDFFEETDLNPENPTVVVMSHLFHDAPVQNRGQFFRDYQRWLEQTLEFAVTKPNVNWVVKEHPRTESSNVIVSIKEIIDSATPAGGADHIHLLSDEINTKSVMNFADVVTTVRGSAGLEFPCFGIPSVSAGRSRYTRFGITHRATSKSEYFEMLSEPESIDLPRANTVERAKAMFGFEKYILCLESDFVPEDSYELPDAEAWQQATEQARELSPETDSAHESIRQFISDPTQMHMVNKQTVDKIKEQSMINQN